jgi:type IV secretion system protein VirB9
MRTVTLSVAAWMVGAVACPVARAQSPDPRLKEIWYDSRAVVTVPVKRGVVTHIVLDPNEAITEVGTGLGADCSKPDASWCIAAQPGGRNIFVKPKRVAREPNNVAVVTDKRTYAMRFVVLPDGDARPPVFRLSIKAEAPKPAAEPPVPSIIAPPAPSEADVVSERLKAAPAVVNSNYSIAEGDASEDIVPTLVFDDGRFTYFRFPNNREVPAVFQVLADGSEALVNTRMEGDLLVVDRVTRRLMLRAGRAVVGIWNEAFDIDGVPPSGETTVSGVERAERAQSAAPGTVTNTGGNP